MDAGVSGSTHYLFQSANLMNGGDGTEVRVAALGYLLFLHHSFHEIMTAAAGQGGGAYSGTCDYLELVPPGEAYLRNLAPDGEIPAAWGDNP